MASQTAQEALQASVQRVALIVKSELARLQSLDNQPDAQQSPAAQLLDALATKVARVYEQAALLSAQKLKAGASDAERQDSMLLSARPGEHSSASALSGAWDRQANGVSTPDGSPPTRSLSNNTSSPASPPTAFPTADVLQAFANDPLHEMTSQPSVKSEARGMAVGQGPLRAAASQDTTTLWPADVSSRTPPVADTTGLATNPLGVSHSIDNSGSGENLSMYVLPGANASAPFLKSVHAALAGAGKGAGKAGAAVDVTSNGSLYNENGAASAALRRQAPMGSLLGQQSEQQQQQLDAFQGNAGLSASLMAQHNLLQQVVQQQAQQQVQQQSVAQLQQQLQAQQQAHLQAQQQAQQQQRFLFQPQQRDKQAMVLQLDNDNSLVRCVDVQSPLEGPSLNNSQRLSYQIDPATGNLVAVVSKDAPDQFFTGLSVDAYGNLVLDEGSSAPSINGFANNAHHIQPHFAGISEPLPTLIDINQLGTTRIAGTTDGTYAAASHVYAPQSANNLLAASLAARSTSNLLPINAGGMPLYQSLLNVRQQPVLLEMPGRFKALPLSVQQRIVALCQANPVISIRDFDDKVVSKLSLLVDSWGVDQAMAMLEHLEQRMRTKQGAMKNGPGYLDVAVCSHLDMLKAQGACPRNMKLDEYAQQVLAPPVFHELCEAVSTNRWLCWDHFDQGIIQLIKRLPVDSAVEKLQEIAYHSFKNVDNIKGCIMSILNSRIREDRKRII